MIWPAFIHLHCMHHMKEGIEHIANLHCPKRMSYSPATKSIVMSAIMMAATMPWHDYSSTGHGTSVGINILKQNSLPLVCHVP
jgi:hypothetical protein